MALVYVADDEPELASMLTEMLQDAGHDVESSPNGQALLDKVAHQTPDLILLDINMPGMSGWDVMRHLQDAPATDSIPVIAVTAQGGATIEKSATTTLHFTDLVRKPFRMAELLKSVDAALAQKGR